jgi:hypothetical protein
MMQETKQSEANAGSGVRALWPSCRQVSLLQSAATQQPLSLGQRIGLKFHLLVCSWCRRYGRQVGFLRTVAHEHDHDETVSAPPALSPNARERMKRSLQDTEN